MPRFKSREEYEKWKAERMGTSEDKPVEPPGKRPDALEKPIEFHEAPVTSAKIAQSPREEPLQLEEVPPKPLNKPVEPQGLVLEPQEIFQRKKEEPWNLEKSFLDFREEGLEPEKKRLELDTGEESGDVPPSRPGGRSRRRRAYLRSTKELLRDSWNIFRTRFLVLIGLYFLPIFLMLGVLGIFVIVSLLSRSFLPLDIKAAVAGGVLIGMIPALIAMSWGMAAFTYAVTDVAVGFTEALSKGWDKLWAFMWVWSLVSFIVTGSFFLLIVPGVLLGIWFFFAPFILACEGEKGMNALLKSKEYVKGQWFPVCGRVAAISLLSFGLGLIPVVGPLVGTVFAPFFLLFAKLIYDDLKAMKGGPVVYPRSGAEKLKWLGLGTVGYMVLPVLVIAVMGASLAVPLLMLKGMMSGQGPYDLSPAEESRQFKPRSVPQPGQRQEAHQESDPADSQAGPPLTPASRARLPEASGEAAVVRNGVKETFVLKTGFFSETRLADPKKASLQFEIEGAGEHSNARRIEIALDATVAGEHRVDGKALEAAFFGKFKNNPGDPPPVQNDPVKFQYVADGGQIFSPKESCVIIITSPYTGASDGVFAGEVKDCLVTSAGIDHTVSAKFRMVGVPSR
jgi:hypothetical protein